MSKTARYSLLMENRSPVENRYAFMERLGESSNTRDDRRTEGRCKQQRRWLDEATEPPKKKRSKEEKERTEELKQYLYRYGVLGTDRRSRAIYDLIDKDLAKRDVSARDSGVSSKTRGKFHELWDNTEFVF